MSNYIPKTKVRWIATRCTNPTCDSADSAVDYVLQRGHVPLCDVCGEPMTHDKGDLEDDKA